MTTYPITEVTSQPLPLDRGSEEWRNQFVSLGAKQKAREAAAQTSPENEPAKTATVHPFSNVPLQIKSDYSHLADQAYASRSELTAKEAPALLAAVFSAMGQTAKEKVGTQKANLLKIRIIASIDIWAAKNPIFSATALMASLVIVAGTLVSMSDANATKNDATKKNPAVANSLSDAVAQTDNWQVMPTSKLQVWQEYFAAQSSNFIAANGSHLSDVKGLSFLKGSFLRKNGTSNVIARFECVKDGQNVTLAAGYNYVAPTATNPAKRDVNLWLFNNQVSYARNELPLKPATALFATNTTPKANTVKKADVQVAMIDALSPGAAFSAELTKSMRSFKNNLAALATTAFMPSLSAPTAQAALPKQKPLLPQVAKMVVASNSTRRDQPLILPTPAQAKKIRQSLGKNTSNSGNAASTTILNISQYDFPVSNMANTGIIIKSPAYAPIPSPSPLASPLAAFKQPEVSAPTAIAPISSSPGMIDQTPSIQSTPRAPEIKPAPAAAITPKLTQRAAATLGALQFFFSMKNPVQTSQLHKTSRAASLTL